MKKAIAISLFLVFNLFLFGQNGKKDKIDHNRLYKGKLSNEDFFNKADYIFEAEYIEGKSYLVDDSTKVYSNFILNITEIYKGSDKLKIGTVNLIRTSGVFIIHSVNEHGEEGAYFLEHHRELDYNIPEKCILFCDESDFTKNYLPQEMKATNNLITLKLLDNWEYAGLDYYEDYEDYNFLIAGLNHLYFKDKKKFYKFAKQFEGIKIPKKNKILNKHKSNNN